jgi:hypothetical protein
VAAISVAHAVAAISVAIVLLIETLAVTLDLVADWVLVILALQAAVEIASQEEVPAALVAGARAREDSPDSVKVREGSVDSERLLIAISWGVFLGYLRTAG